MTSTNPQSDDGTGPPLLPFSGIDRDSAFDLPYAVDPTAPAALPPPPDPPAAPPPPPSSPLPPRPSSPPERTMAAATVPVPGPPSRPTSEPEPDPVLRGPRPFLPPNFSKPGTAAPARDEPVGPSRPPAPPSTPAPSTPAALPPPLSAQPLSGPVVPVGEDAPAAVEADPTAALPPMVAARTFETPDPVPVDGSAAGPLALPDAPHLGPDAPPPAPPGAHAAAPAGRAAPPPILSRRRTRESPDPAPATGPGGSAAVGPLTMSPDAPIPTVPTGPLTMSPDAPIPVAPPAPAAPAGPTIAPLVPGTPAPAAPPATADPTGPRVADGLLVGLAASAVAGGVWWAVVALTQRQFPYLAVLLGLLVGQGVLVGSRRGSLALGALAGVLTLVGLSVAQYFISRSLAISELGLDVPLWEGAGRAVDVIRATYQDDALTLVFVLLAAGCAAFAAGRTSARPVT